MTPSGEGPVKSPSGNDTPYSPVAGVDPFTLDTRFRSYQTGAYLQASKQVAPRVNVTLGGRFDHYVTGLAWSPMDGRRVTAEARRLSALVGVGDIGPALASRRPPVYALRSGGVHAAAARRL